MKLAADAKHLISERLAAAPANPVAGRRYYDTARNVERYYNGTAWIDLDDPVHVGPGTPTTSLEPGDMWFDTDESAATGTALPLTIADGGTGATNASSARGNLAVPAIGNSTTTAGAPTTGTWARGDQWLDSDNAIWTCVAGGTPGSWRTPSTPRVVGFSQSLSSVDVANNGKYQIVFTVNLPVAGGLNIWAIVYSYRFSGTGGGEIYHSITQAAGYAAPTYGGASIGIQPTTANGYMAVPILGRFGTQPAGSFSFGVNLDNYGGTTTRYLGAAGTVWVQP